MNVMLDNMVMIQPLRGCYPDKPFKPRFATGAIEIEALQASMKYMDVPGVTRLTIAPKSNINPFHVYQMLFTNLFVISLKGLHLNNHRCNRWKSPSYPTPTGLNKLKE
ncbi:hypothetical protein BH20BAC1_BH20BAC1_20180 [soil metagenome]